MLMMLWFTRIDSRIALHYVIWKKNIFDSFSTKNHDNISRLKQNETHFHHRGYENTLSQELRIRCIYISFSETQKSILIRYKSFMMHLIVLQYFKHNGIKKNHWDKLPLVFYSFKKTYFSLLLRSHTKNSITRWVIIYYIGLKHKISYY